MSFGVSHMGVCSMLGAPRGVGERFDFVVWALSHSFLLAWPVVFGLYLYLVYGFCPFNKNLLDGKKKNNCGRFLLCVVESKAIKERQ